MIHGVGRFFSKLGEGAILDRYWVPEGDIARIRCTQDGDGRPLDGWVEVTKSLTVREA